MDPDPEWTSPPRDVPTPRPIPGTGGRPRRRTPPTGADLARRTVDPVVPDDAPGAAGRVGGSEEPPWVRERREEADFAREFGDWRGGGPSGRSSRGPGRSRGTAMVPVLLFLVAVAVVLAVVL